MIPFSQYALIINEKDFRTIDSYIFRSVDEQTIDPSYSFRKNAHSRCNYFAEDDVDFPHSYFSFAESPQLFDICFLSGYSYRPAQQIAVLLNNKLPIMIRIHFLEIIDDKIKRKILMSFV